MNATQLEHERQQALMAALLAPRDDAAALQRWVAHAPTRTLRGLQAYRANAGALAERALASTYPTVQALLGEASFAELARAYWHAHPPERGDMALFGAALAEFIAGSAQLSEVPYVADCARLDQLLVSAERAVDCIADVNSLNLLAQADPAQLRLELTAGAALLSSAFPVASIWLAHQKGSGAAEHMASARDMLARADGEHAFVWREAWRACVLPVSEPVAKWTQSLLDGKSMSVALVHAGAGFEFEPWLVQALQRGWLARVVLMS